jgi:hypothetical protein
MHAFAQDRIRFAALWRIADEIGELGLHGYTFRMRTVFWLAVIGAIFTICWIAWYSLRKWKERRIAEEQRLASFMAETAGRARMLEAAVAPAALAATPAISPVDDIVATQKLLFEAAHKAGDAGEPAIAIQLYARLLARYPQTAFADQARAAVEAQKKKLGKA